MRLTLLLTIVPTSPYVSGCRVTDDTFQRLGPHSDLMTTDGRQPMGGQLALSGVNLRFGGIGVPRRRRLRGGPEPDLRSRGTQRRRQDVALQLHQRALPSQLGLDHIDGAEVLGTAPATLARHGLARTFQHPALQLQATVLENVMLGAHTRLPGGPLAWSLRSRRLTRAEGELRVEALDLLDRNGLGWAATAARGRAVPRPAQGDRALSRPAVATQAAAARRAGGPDCPTPRSRT